MPKQHLLGHWCAFSSHKSANLAVPRSSVRFRRKWREHHGMPEIKGILWEIEGPLARVTLNRPEVLNAMNLAWPQEVLAITDALARDKSVKVVLIRGAGRAFCSGIDLKSLSGGGIPLQWFRDTELAVRAVEELEKFVI